MALSDFDLGGRVAAITGGGGGLGRALALGLAGHGSAIAAIDQDGNAAEACARDVRAAGGRAMGVAADVADPAAVRAAFAGVAGELGPVDILVNNAGIQSHVPPEHLEATEWERVLAVNAGSYLWCAQAVFDGMVARGGGSIVNVSSITGVTAHGRGNLAYSTSKAAVLQLTRELAVEWARHGIRVNAIVPAQVRTPMLERTLAGGDAAATAKREHFLRSIPLGRFAEPEDLVGPVVLLASDAGAFVTGVALPVDGGNLALNAGGGAPWASVPSR